MLGLPDDAWLLSSRDGRFVRGDGVWLHGPGCGSWEGLPVPGAKELCLAHVLDPSREIPWDRLGSARWRWLALHAVELQDPDLARTDPSRAVGEQGRWAVRALLRDWEDHRDDVIGVRAPELATDFRRYLAVAGLDLAIAERELVGHTSACRTLVLEAAAHFGMTCGQLALASGVSRSRVHQWLREEEAQRHSGDSHGSTRTRDAVVRAVREEALQRLRAADAVRAAQAVRMRRVVTARGQGYSHGAIAASLGVTRGRVQQLHAAGLRSLSS